MRPTMHPPRRPALLLQPTRPAWQAWAWAAAVVMAACTLGWLAAGPESPAPDAALVPGRQDLPQQARLAGQDWPFAATATLPAPATPAPSPDPGAAFLHAAAQAPASPANAPEEDAALNPGQHNLGIAPQQLSSLRPVTAEAFLRHVALKPHPRGGFEVQAVAPGSVYARLGLQPGDVVHSLDPPGAPVPDESSMVALMQVSAMELEVVRANQPLRLRLALNEESAADEPYRPPADHP
jgi:hypothetical protein